MKIIITGGSGLIGRALAASFSADGNEVVLLSRSPERVSGLPQGVRAGSAIERRTACLTMRRQGVMIFVNASTRSQAAEAQRKDGFP